MNTKSHTIHVNIQYFSCKKHGSTGNLIPGPTGIGPRNTPHLVQLNITWTGLRSNGPSDLVQGIHLPL